MALIIMLLIAAGLPASKNFSPDPAITFLNSLDSGQKKKTQLPFDDRSRDQWHYFPAGSSHSGINLGELNESQKDLFFKFLRSYLSESGFDKTVKIIELEGVLGELENNPSGRDPEKYFITVYGDPAKDKLWAWSFEGHHLSLNFTSLNNEISIAPRFMGANPAVIPSGKRKGEQTLEKEESLGFALINALAPEQKQKAIIREKAFWDIATSNESQVGPLEPAGIKLKDLQPGQKEILLDLIDEYLSAMPDELAAKRMNNLKEEEFDEIRFGWAGATMPGQPHYYRVQGKTFLIELDNTQNGANHIHSVWRDFGGDFGRDLIREHYQQSHHHRK
jgi:hypothetical protein